MSIALVWLRQDLRLQDNPALFQACLEHDEVIPLFIKDDDFDLQFGQAQAWWLHHSLQDLQHYIPLVLKSGPAKKIILELCQQHKIDTVYWNRCYDPFSIARDSDLKKQLIEKDITVNSYNGSLLLEPWQVKNASGDYYKVYTPFYKFYLQHFQPRELLATAKPIYKTKIKSEKLNDWQLLPNKPDWASGFADHWHVSEEAAHKKLQLFLNDPINNYTQGRDRPDTQATSRLSPYLHFGQISPMQIWHAVTQCDHDPAINYKACEKYLAEVIWREFSYNLLYYFPNLKTKNFKSEFDKFPWQKNIKALQAWQKGLTGFPIVDAGMRELWQTGYMHNRVRMITASFLIKDLLIDWREGEKWFWDCLLDADHASNTASWQWVAGSGADAAPYFRIFNPILQGEKFDPQGDYVKKWIPELSKLDKKYIHQPWQAPLAELQKANIILGETYPAPLVDHKTAREQALVLYKKLKD